jgi:hypothetical protein
MTEESKQLWKEGLKTTLGFAGCGYAVIGPFYTAFVVQTLWNWFVAEALHSAEISYWQAFGMLILVMVLSRRDTDKYEREIRWKQTKTMLEECLTPARRYTLQEEFKKEESSWAEIISRSDAPLGKAVLNTFALLAGFAVHTFLI